MRTLLKALVAERGMTILLSSHLLHEVEQVATRIGIIRDGRLLLEATVDEMRAQQERSLEVVVSHPDQAVALLARNDLAVFRLTEREPSLESIFFYIFLRRISVNQWSGKE